jgi:protein-disulfide isomerase
MPPTAPQPQSRQNLAVPIAIIIAGAMIATAVLLSGSNRGTAPKPRKVLDSNLLIKIADKIGIDENKFKECLSSDRYKAQIEKDVQKAVKAGAGGTPYSIIIKGEERILINGAEPIEGIRIKIDEGSTDISDRPQANAEIEPVSATDHILGDPNAEIVIVEYSDLGCPFCKIFHATMHEIVDEYEGKVAWVYRHYPIKELHPIAPEAAEASECVAELGGNAKFWEYIDEIFSEL